MRTSNPALSDAFFGRHAQLATERGALMSMQGTLNKTFLLLAIAAATAFWTWSRFLAAGRALEAVAPMMGIGVIGGLVLCLVLCFKASWAPVGAPIYAALEGLFIGGLSSILEVRFPGIVLQAVGLTFGVFLVMLVLYSTRVLRATPAFTKGVIAATLGVALLYLASMIMGMFGARIPYIHEGGAIGIGFSLFVVGLAALNLILDFDTIEKGAQQGAPKYMEWYGGFALLVTLVWLYVEILRLLAKLNDRR
jgi:uncharacterized YccA/Bax inhibitor family protein